MSRKDDDPKLDKSRNDTDRKTHLVDTTGGLRDSTGLDSDDDDDPAIREDMDYMDDMSIITGVYERLLRYISTRGIPMGENLTLAKLTGYFESIN